MLKQEIIDMYKFILNKDKHTAQDLTNARVLVRIWKEKEYITPMKINKN